jgi:hypothetical protein
MRLFSIRLIFLAIFTFSSITYRVLHADDGLGDAKLKNAKQSTENEKVVPTTLEEAHRQLENQFPKEELIKIDAMKSENEMIEYHFGLGMQLRNSWGLWKGSPLWQYMHELGFTHPDDMSGVILETFWCKRHGKDFRLKKRAEYYAAYWKSVADPPKTLKDPNDGSQIEWAFSLGAGDDKKPRQIHLGKSKKSGRWLAYEYDKGVYVPGMELLDRIAEFEKHNK